MLPKDGQTTKYSLGTFAVLPDGNEGFTPCPELMTESELIQFLRIPKVSNSKNYHNVIEHLKNSKSTQNSYMQKGFISQEGCLGMDRKRNQYWKIKLALQFTTKYNSVYIV